MYTVEMARQEIEDFRNLFINGQYDEKVDPFIKTLGLCVVVDAYPDMIEEVAPLVIEATRKTEFYFGFSPRLTTEKSAKKLLEIYKKEVTSPDNNSGTLHAIYYSAQTLIDEYPGLVNDAFAIFKAGLKSNNNDNYSLETLYLYMSKLIRCKPAFAKDPELLDLIEARIPMGQEGDRALGFCYMLFGEIIDHNPNAGERILKIMNTALKSPKNDNWAIPRAYGALKGILKARKDLVSKVISCAGDIPSYNTTEDIHYDFNKQDVISMCHQLFLDIVKKRPDFMGRAYESMQQELKYRHDQENEILKTIDKQLDTKPSPIKEITFVLGNMLNNAIQEGHAPYGYEYFESAVLKLPPKNIKTILPQLITGIYTQGGNSGPTLSERCLGTIRNILKQNTNLAQDVLNGIAVAMQHKRFNIQEVQILSDIMIIIAQYKPKFMPQVVDLVNVIWANIENDDRQVFYSLANSYNSTDILDAKVREMREKIAEINEARKKAAFKGATLEIGKTGNITTGVVEATHKEAAEIQIGVSKLVHEKYHPKK